MAVVFSNGLKQALLEKYLESAEKSGLNAFNDPALSAWEIEARQREMVERRKVSYQTQLEILTAQANSCAQSFLNPLKFTTSSSGTATMDISTFIGGGKEIEFPEIPTLSCLGEEGIIKLNKPKQQLQEYIDNWLGGIKIPTLLNKIPQAEYKILICSGSKPYNIQSALCGTILVEMFSVQGQYEAINAGTAGYFRVIDRKGNVTFDGSIYEVGGDMYFRERQITVGDQFVLFEYDFYSWVEGKQKADFIRRIT